MPDTVEQQCKKYSKQHHGKACIRHSKQHAHCHAGQRGVPQRIGKKCQPVIDDHSADQPEQRGNQQHRQQCVLHKIVPHVLKRKQRFHYPVDCFHPSSFLSGRISDRAARLFKKLDVLPL